MAGLDRQVRPSLCYGQNAFTGSYEMPYMVSGTVRYHNNRTSVAFAADVDLPGRCLAVVLPR